MYMDKEDKKLKIRYRHDTFLIVKDPHVANNNLFCMMNPYGIDHDVFYPVSAITSSELMYFVFAQLN